MASYSLQTTKDGPSITCLVCGMTSYSPGDIEHLYCGNCKVFHKPETETK